MALLSQVFRADNKVSGTPVRFPITESIRVVACNDYESGRAKLIGKTPTSYFYGIDAEIDAKSLREYLEGETDTFITEAERRRKQRERNTIEANSNGRQVLRL